MSDVRSLCHLFHSLHKCHKESIQSLTELALGDAEAVGAESADGLGIAADEGEEPDPAMSAGYVNRLCNSKAAELGCPKEAHNSTGCVQAAERTREHSCDWARHAGQHTQAGCSSSAAQVI